AACISFSLFVVARRTLVLRPPHRPLSVVTTMKPTALASLLATMNGCLYSGVARERLAARLRTIAAYGRAARIASWAFLIFDAATISIALVIFFVFSTLLILPRISLPAAIACHSFSLGRIRTIS